MFIGRAVGSIFVVFCRTQVQLQSPTRSLANAAPAFFSPPPTNQEDWHAFNFVVDVCFLVDLAARFLTAYHDEYANRMVYRPMQIARHYSRGLLVFDLIASIPLTIVSLFCFWGGRHSGRASCRRRFMLLRSAAFTELCCRVRPMERARVVYDFLFFYTICVSRYSRAGFITAVGLRCPHHCEILSWGKVPAFLTHTGDDGTRPWCIPAWCTLDRSQRFGEMVAGLVPRRPHAALSPHELSLGLSRA